MKIKIIGAGLAGSECAFQLAQRAHSVDLFEMRPAKMTPAHQTSNLAELDFSKLYWKSRYDKGSGRDYVNAPMNREQYEAFVNALLRAEIYPLHDFEQAVHFEGCLPIEEIASRGVETLRFGPMKPVGLEHPMTGGRPYAVLQ